MTSIIKIEKIFLKNLIFYYFFFILKSKNAYNYFIGYFKEHVYR
jgi:hypothetical protein